MQTDICLVSGWTCSCVVETIVGGDFRLWVRWDFFKAKSLFVSNFGIPRPNLSLDNSYFNSSLRLERGSYNYISAAITNSHRHNTPAFYISASCSMVHFSETLIGWGRRIQVNTTPDNVLLKFFIHTFYIFGSLSELIQNFLLHFGLVQFLFSNIFVRALAPFQYSNFGLGQEHLLATTTTLAPPTQLAKSLFHYNNKNYESNNDKRKERENSLDYHKKTLGNNTRLIILQTETPSNLPSISQLITTNESVSVSFSFLFLLYLTWFVCLFGFYGISTFVGYLMPNPLLYK